MSVFQIGITGNIGSGKSTICRLFQVIANIPVYDADSQAKQMMAEDLEIRKAIIKTFGLESYLNNNINRKFLADQVFNQPERLKLLNEIVHPGSANRYQDWLKRQNVPITIKEAALLFEATNWRQLSAIIVVKAPETLKMQRIKQRDPFRTEAQIKGIIANQLKQEEMVRNATFTIDNDNLSPVIPQVLHIYKQILAQLPNL
jgi:dephospho-CoA kinase